MAPSAHTVRYSRIVDLSQPIGPHTQMFPAYPPPTFTQWTTRDVHGFYAESLFLISHTGTHVDAPFHFEPGGRKLHELPLEHFMAPGHMLDLRAMKEKGLITPERLEKARRKLRGPLRRGDAAILRTGWERRGGSNAYLFENPGLSEAGAKQLVRWGVGLVGIDTANIDHPEGAAYPAHHRLLQAGVPIIENVTNLAALRGSRFFVIALPLSLHDVSGSPIRLVALV